jgi:hypothetical protein
MECIRLIEIATRKTREAIISVVATVFPRIMASGVYRFIYVRVKEVTGGVKVRECKKSLDNPRKKQIFRGSARKFY